MSKLRKQHLFPFGFALMVPSKYSRYLKSLCKTVKIVGLWGFFGLFWGRWILMMQVADMHYGNGRLTRCRDVLENEFQYCSDLNTTRFLEKMIQLEKPDLIAFTGTKLLFLWIYTDVLFIGVLHRIRRRGWIEIVLISNSWLFGCLR